MENLKYEVVNDLNKIKKEYGEEMSHLCKDLFPTILEKPGLLYHIISTNFSKSRHLYNDIIAGSKVGVFKDYISFIYDKMSPFNDKLEDNRTVRDLLKENGYTLYECKTNEDIQRFRRYYADREALCTFRDPKRIDNHYIFFIVKDNVDEIRREDFVNPQREDKYSVSVLDLQFDKGKKQRVSIKSRYNHTVNSPDATYSNNLENIAKGLTKAFEREYGFNIGNKYEVNFELDGYVESRDGKYYKYNREINNIHYGPDNIIIDDGNVVEEYLDKSRYLIIDYFIIDLQEKKISLYDTTLTDSFINGLDNITNIEVVKQDDNKKIRITQSEGREALIVVDNLGRIISYENNYLQECGDDFLGYNNSLRKLDLPSLQSCGRSFLHCNNSLQELDLPSLQRCGDGFLYENKILQKLDLPELESCGQDCLFWNQSLQELDLPSLQRCGYGFLENNQSLQTIYLPKLEEYGAYFFGGRFTYDDVKGGAKK